MPLPNLRLSYNASIPFSWKYTLLLYAFYIFGFIGLLVWNFLSSAKGLQCTSYYSGNYNSEICEPTPLEFSREYFTRPVDANAANTSIGTFPWTPLAFGKDNGPLDYSILSLNWTANPLQCVLYEQYLTLHLLSEGSTVNSCYYCGPDLRILCTTIDSERSQIPDSSADAYVSILDSFNTLSVQTHQIATSAQEGATVGSVRINVHRPVAGLEEGVLKYTDSMTMVMLGTTLGSFPIYANSSNSGVAQVARTAESLSTLVEQATSLDLQPAAADASGQPRTLQASYICRDCRKRYKPTLEIIALLITGIFGVLTPAFALAKLVAEWSSPPPDQQTLSDSNVPYSAVAGGGGKTPLATPFAGPSQDPMMQQLPQQPYQGGQPYQGMQQPYQGQPYQQPPYQQV